MATGAYVGISGVARKVKKIYVGVNGVARKVKKAYVGVNGLARLFYKTGELAYHGTATALSDYRQQLAATTIGGYALFGGGVNFLGVTQTLDAYDRSLTRSTPTMINTPRRMLAATIVGRYALFGGGCYLDGAPYNIVTCYDESLTRGSASNLSVARSHLAATRVGNYALFGGGYSATNGASSNVVDAYSASLTLSNPTTLSMHRDTLAATSVGNYALFGGGRYQTGMNTSSQNISASNRVDAYDAALTRSNPTNMSSVWGTAATTVGNYALFGGGGWVVFDVDAESTVYAYDAALTRSTATPLSVARYNLAATTVGGYAIFGGGSIQYRNEATGINGEVYDMVDAYDAALTHRIPLGLSVSRHCLAATSVGNYALFGGGGTGDEMSGSTSGNVDVYTAA